ncbi:MAG: TraR/DksA family transcriptional regulator [Desulfobacterium sp.]|nr:TraR/DksA family transcriptional regulator [Desulfobacteraceae bacterium]MBA3036760.1 TraR/DksA family transcriptional regulator [Desulfobacterium sp.]
MPDEADLAQGMERKYLRLSLKAMRKNPLPLESKTHCEACGDPMPERRRKAEPGCRRCVTCQADFEQCGGR